MVTWREKRPELVVSIRKKIISWWSIEKMPNVEKGGGHRCSLGGRGSIHAGKGTLVFCGGKGAYCLVGHGNIKGKKGALVLGGKKGGTNVL